MLFLSKKMTTCFYSSCLSNVNLSIGENSRFLYVGSPRTWGIPADEMVHVFFRTFLARLGKPALEEQGGLGDAQRQSCSG